MLSWAFPVVSTVWGLQPVVWVVTVSGALSQSPRHSSRLPKSQEEPLFLGQTPWEDLDFSVVLAMSTLCRVSTSGMRSWEVHWRNYAERQPLGMFVNGRILFQGRLKGCESSVKARAFVCSAGWCSKVHLCTEKSNTWLLQGASLPQGIPIWEYTRARGEHYRLLSFKFPKHWVIWVCVAGGLSKVRGVDGQRDHCWQQTRTLKKGSLRILAIVTGTFCNCGESNFFLFHRTGFLRIQSWYPLKLNKGARRTSFCLMPPRMYVLVLIQALTAAFL